MEDVSDRELKKLSEFCALPLSVLQSLDFDFPQQDAEIFTAIAESDLSRQMQGFSTQDSVALSFLGAGSCDNFIPAAVRAQSALMESSLHDLHAPSFKKIHQIKRDVEDNLAALSALPFCSVLPEDLTSVLVNLLISLQQSGGNTKTGKPAKVLLPASLSPPLRKAMYTQLRHETIDPVITNFDLSTGCLTVEQLKPYDHDGILALLLPWPNFFGLLEDVAGISDWAGCNGIKVIGIVNPLILSCLQSPVQLSGDAIDYLVGELQSLGLAMNKTGQTPCFIASRNELPAMQALTGFNADSAIDLLQAWSYMSLLGSEGMSLSVQKSRTMMSKLIEKLKTISEVSIRFTASWVNECVIQIEHIDLEKAVKILAGHNIISGFRLQNDYPELNNCLLLHCNDQHHEKDLEKFVNKLATVVKNLSTAGCPVKPKF